MLIPGSQNHQIDELRRTIAVVGILQKKIQRLTKKLEARGIKKKEIKDAVA